MRLEKLAKMREKAADGAMSRKEAADGAMSREKAKRKGLLVEGKELEVAPKHVPSEKKAPLIPLEREFASGLVEGGPPEKAKTYAGKGGWGYKLHPDGTVEITSAPQGHKAGARLKGGTAYEAIMKEMAGGDGAPAAPKAPVTVAKERASVTVSPPSPAAAPKESEQEIDRLGESEQEIDHLGESKQEGTGVIKRSFEAGKEALKGFGQGVLDAASNRPLRDMTSAAVDRAMTPKDDGGLSDKLTKLVQLKGDRSSLTVRDLDTATRAKLKADPVLARKLYEDRVISQELYEILRQG